jgi:hypothetical protein
MGKWACRGNCCHVAKTRHVQDNFSSGLPTCDKLAAICCLPQENDYADSREAVIPGRYLYLFIEGVLRCVE